MSYTPGPGDAETWPHCSGHPHDPRAPDDDSDDTTAESIAEVRCFLVEADLAAKSGEIGKAREAMIDAVLAIAEIIGAEK